MVGGSVRHTYDQDRQLLRRVLHGDRAAFDLFVDEYYPRLYRFALRRLGGESEAAREVVQSTFTSLMPKLATYRGEAALFTWVCAFCRYEIAAYQRRCHRHSPEVELRDDSPDVRAALESLGALDDSADEALERAEVAQLVRTTLDYLPIRYSQALEWKYINGLPVREIASRLGVSYKAAESVLTRARQAFRDGFVALSGA